MLIFGIVGTSFGYTLVYYGVKLWAGAPVTLAYAIGLAKTNTATTSSSSTASSTTGNVSQTGTPEGKIPKLPKLGPGAKSVPAGPGRPPLIAPNP